MWTYYSRERSLKVKLLYKRLLLFLIFIGISLGYSDVIELRFGNLSKIEGRLYLDNYTIERLVNEGIIPILAADGSVAYFLVNGDLVKEANNFVAKEAPEIFVISDPTIYQQIPIFVRERLNSNFSIPEELVELIKESKDSQQILENLIAAGYDISQVYDLLPPEEQFELKRLGSYTLYTIVKKVLGTPQAEELLHLIPHITKEELIKEAMKKPEVQDFIRKLLSDPSLKEMWKRNVFRYLKAILEDPRLLRMVLTALGATPFEFRVEIAGFLFSLYQKEILLFLITFIGILVGWLVYGRWVRV